METIKITIQDKNIGIRLDKFLATVLSDLSRTRLQQMIRNGHVLVNGNCEKSSYLLQQEDVLTIEIEEDKQLDIQAEDLPIDIVYEDADVIVINKPSGMIVHPSAGIYQGTLVNALMFHCKDLSGINGVIRPGIVHRIDKDTSGLLMVAKNDNAHLQLSKQLKEHSVERKYLAIVHGVICHDYGKIDAPIGRDQKDRQKMAVTDVNSKNACTNFRVIKRFKDATLVECHLETGRTHQIRVHMQFIGHPVYGDPKYGRRKDDCSFGQYLHAKTLGFIHPKTNKKMVFDSKLPDEFQQLLDQLNEEME